MRRMILVLSLVFMAAPFAAQEAESQPVGFRAYDIFIESDAPLVAYQVEVTYDAKTVKVVGVEGGAPELFADAPTYDPSGMSGGRIIIAAFHTDDKNAPKGRLRVARLHLQVEGNEAPTLAIRPMTAARPGGEIIQVKAAIQAANLEA